MNRDRVRTIAVREFLTTVRRKGFVLTLFLMPLYGVFATVMGVLPTMLAKQSREARVVAIVDPGNVLGVSAGQDVKMDEDWTARFFATPDDAFQAFQRGDVRSVLRLAPDYIESGRTAQYRQVGGLFTARSVGPPYGDFMRRQLLSQRVDSSVVSRALDPLSDSIYVASARGGFEREDRTKRLLLIFVPMAFGFIMSIGIFTAGSYLLQGLGEEKESRILESLLALVTPDELMAGKLLGLGAASLLLVLIWGGLGSVSLLTSAAAISIGPWTYVIAVFYFFAGFFFFASFMLGVGSLVSTYQEANQWVAMISLSAMFPFFMISTILDQPNGPVATGMSMFPWTAPVTMMMRLPAGGVPGWELALSMLILGASALLMLRGAARVFRIGLLMYDKTPNLPEILRWARTK